MATAAGVWNGLVMMAQTHLARPGFRQAAFFYSDRLLFVELGAVGDAAEGNAGTDAVDAPARQRPKRHRVAPEAFVDHVHRAAQ